MIYNKIASGIIFIFAFYKYIYTLLYNEYVNAASIIILLLIIIVFVQLKITKSKYFIFYILISSSLIIIINYYKHGFYLVNIRPISTGVDFFELFVFFSIVIYSLVSSYKHKKGS